MLTHNLTLALFFLISIPFTLAAGASTTAPRRYFDGIDPNTVKTLVSSGTERRFSPNAMDGVDWTKTTYTDGKGNRKVVYNLPGNFFEEYHLYNDRNMEVATGTKLISKDGVTWKPQGIAQHY